MSKVNERCALRPSVGASRLVGDPVDIVTGAVIDQDTEFRVPGARIPFVWARYYDSAQAAQDRGLGRGFRHELDHELRLDVDGLTYCDPRWSTIEFPFLTLDGERVRAHGHVLERLKAKTYRLELPTGRSLEFGFVGQEQVARLELNQERESYLTLQYEGRSHQLQGVGLGDVGSLRVEWNEGRIARVVLVEPEPKAEQIVAVYRYDEQGCLVEAQNPHRHKLKYAYDSAQRLVRKTDKRGYAFHFIYDADGRCIESRGDDGAEAVRLEYRPVERTTIVTRHDGGKWQYQYTDFGAITNILEPGGGMQSYVLDDDGRVVQEIDPLGNETRILHDEHGLPWMKLDAWGYSLALNGDNASPHPLDHRTPKTPLEYMYGSLFPAPERLPATGDQLWNVPWQARRVIATAEPDWGGRVQRDFSVFGTPLRDRREDGKTRRWAYDENSRLRWIQDFDGGKRSFEYVSDSHLARETNAVGAVTRFEHSPTGRLIAMTDACGTRSEFPRDTNERVIEVRRHGRTRERYTYDLGGNLVEKRDAHGALLLEMTIGKGNQDLARKLGSGEVQSFTYDERGRLTEARGDAGSCTFAYSSWGTLTADLRDELGVQHRVDGAHTNTRVLGKFTVSYRTLRGGVVEVTDPTGRSHQLQTIGHGIVEHKWCNGVREVTQFGVDGRCLSKTLLRFEGDDRPWQRCFRFSGEGDLLERRDNERGDITYRYDAAHRLVHVGHANGRGETYEHDLAGNLLRMPSPFWESRALDHGQRMELQAGNRLLRVDAEQFYYDDRDHIARREKPYGTTEYVRDALDQLVRVRAPGVEVASQYDPLGRRTGKRVNDQETSYYWDGDRLAAEVFPSGAVRVYVYAAPLAMVPLMFVDYASLDAEPESGRRYYVVSDHRGAVELILNDKAEPEWSARLDPYGLAHVEIGTRFYMPLRFPGHFYDAESGLHYNRFRYYDPGLGRYLESDPIGIAGGRNVYAYTTNPLRFVDLRGLNEDCVECQKAKAAAEASDDPNAKRMCPAHENAEDSDPAVLPASPKPKKTEAPDPPWPPRTLEANLACHDVGKAIKEINDQHMKKTGRPLVSKHEGTMIDVRTHHDGSRSVGVSGIDKEQAAAIEKHLNSSPEGKQFAADKENEGRPKWRVRGEADEALTGKLPEDPEGGKPPENCAEGRAASASRENPIGENGHDTIERAESSSGKRTDKGDPSPYALSDDSPQKIDGATRQVSPCKKCQNRDDVYNNYANEKRNGRGT